MRGRGGEDASTAWMAACECASDGMGYATRWAVPRGTTSTPAGNQGDADGRGEEEPRGGVHRLEYARPLIQSVGSARWPAAKAAWFICSVLCGWILLGYVAMELDRVGMPSSVTAEGVVVALVGDLVLAAGLWWSINGFRRR